MNQTLKEILVDALFLDLAPSEIKDDTPLADYGVDSFKMLEYISALEENLDIHFQPSDICEENLRSIATIQRLVESR